MPLLLLPCAGVVAVGGWSTRKSPSSWAPVTCWSVLAPAFSDLAS
jgi:hypothetical protein